MEHSRRDLIASEGATGALVVSVKEGNGATGCLSAHLAQAAVRTGMRVLIVDLTRGGALGASFPPSTTSGNASGLTVSQLFRPPPPVLDPEQLSPWLSIVRFDAWLFDAALSATDAAQRLSSSLAQFLIRYDMCIVELSEDDTAALPSVLAEASCLVTTSTVGNRASGAGPRRLKRLQAGVRVAAASNPKLRGLTLLPLATPLSPVITDSGNRLLADRLLFATFGERIAHQQLLAA